MSMQLIHPSGIIKVAPTGFSWTTLFFGGWVMLFRGDWKHLILHAFFMLITIGISSFIYPFFYNKVYIKNLLLKGFQPLSADDHWTLNRKVL